MELNLIKAPENQGPPQGALCMIGRPVGGIRPRRIQYWLGSHAQFDRTLRPTRTRWGYRMNLSPHYFLDRAVMAFGTYDRALHDVLRQFVKPGMVCCDIGANIGEVTMQLAQLVQPGGAVYAFEPAPFPLSRLKDNVALNGFEQTVTVLPLALSDAEGRAEFAFADESADNQGMGSLHSRNGGVASNLTQVRTRRLDDVANELGLQRLDLVKVDIQGAEMLMLAGAEETLRRFKPRMLVELSPGDLAATNYTTRDLVGRLDSFGYDIFEVLTGGKTGPRINPATVDPHFGASNALCVAR